MGIARIRTPTTNIKVIMASFYRRPERTGMIRRPHAPTQRNLMRGMGAKPDKIEAGACAEHRASPSPDSRAMIDHVVAHADQPRVAPRLEA